MSIDAKTAIEHIDSILKRREEFLRQDEWSEWSDDRTAEMTALECAAIDSLAPPGSAYLEMKKRALGETGLSEECIQERLAGILFALRTDYAAGRMQSFKELVHADLFADFLELAEYYVGEGHKDAAAVIAGGVLEEHLRKLSVKHGTVLSGRPKLDLMNADLSKRGAYGTIDQKQITAWAGIRNHAAHGHYNEYGKEQVELMLSGIRQFISRNPA
jgi:hypothetical protein